MSVFFDEQRQRRREQHVVPMSRRLFPTQIQSPICDRRQRQRPWQRDPTPATFFRAVTAAPIPPRTPPAAPPFDRRQ
ncbi:hypothetical protein ACLOJK_039004 [Asimina triloba]